MLFLYCIGYALELYISPFFISWWPLKLVHTIIIQYLNRLQWLNSITWGHTRPVGWGWGMQTPPPHIWVSSAGHWDLLLLLSDETVQWRSESNAVKELSAPTCAEILSKWYRYSMLDQTAILTSAIVDRFCKLGISLRRCSAKFRIYHLKPSTYTSHGAPIAKKEGKQEVKTCRMLGS